MLCLHVIFSYHNHHTSKQVATVTVCFFLSLLVSGAPPCGFASPAQPPAIMETTFRVTPPLTAGTLTA